MKKILILAGTRPEVIKLAPLVQQLHQSKILEPILCLTGQHSSMLDQTIKAFGLETVVNLSVMTENQSLAQLTSRIISGASDLIADIDPDVVLVHGDTTTTMACALASAYLNKPVAHVEAGLRTHDISAPFPEELNRQVVARIAKWNFAPTELAGENLVREGVHPSSVFVTGNTIVDALMLVVERIQRNEGFRDLLMSRLLANLGGRQTVPEFILFTAHRRENFGQGINLLCDFLISFAGNNPERQVLLPVHPNPNIASIVRSRLNSIPTIRLIEPLDYEDLIFSMMMARLVITDSGGIQEEAISLGKHVVVTRVLTERSEGVRSGLMHVTGTNIEALTKIVDELLLASNGDQLIEIGESPYGDGLASERIVKILEKLA